MLGWMRWPRPLWDLYKRSRRCAGARLRDQLELLDRALDLVQRNARALHASLPSPRDANVTILASGGRLRHEKEVASEFARALHNVLASCATLEAAMRELLETAPRGALLRSHYEARHEELFVRSGEAAFAMQLQALTLRGLPAPWVLTLSDRVERIALSRQDLRMLHAWTGAARDFIRGPGEDIAPGHLVDAYVASWTALHRWLVERLTRAHRPELAERERLRREFGRALRGKR